MFYFSGVNFGEFAVVLFPGCV
jgi:hypothetical protein